MSNTEISIEAMIDYICEIESEYPDDGWIETILKHGCKGYIDYPEDEIRERYKEIKASEENTEYDTHEEDE
jgi:hypothetical protein